MVQFLTFLNIQNYRDQNQISGFSGVGNGGVATKWHKEAS